MSNSADYDAHEKRRETDLLLEVGHPSRPDREELMRQHIDRIKARTFREAADILNQLRAEHLIASTRAPAASHLFRAEQIILGRADALASRPIASAEGDPS